MFRRCRRPRSCHALCNYRIFAILLAASSSSVKKTLTENLTENSKCPQKNGSAGSPNFPEEFPTRFKVIISVKESC